MKKNKLIALIVVCMLAVTGCGGDKKYNEMMTEGQDFIASGNYEQALECFSAALEEKEGDEEANSLYQQVEKLMQVAANINAKQYEQAIKISDELISNQGNSDIVIAEATKLKQEAQDLKTEEEKLSFREDIIKDMDEAKALIKEKEYMKAKTKLNYVLEELEGKEAEFEAEIKECKDLIKDCNKALDEIKAKKEKEKEDSEAAESYEVDFNDELKSQIAVAGANYVEYYFEYGEGSSPSKFANSSYEDTENDTPLGKYKEEGRKIFVDAFKKAYEATGNEYY